MVKETSELEEIAASVAAELSKSAPGRAANAKEAAPPTRDLFLEMIVLALGALYAKVPMGSSLYDRATLKAALSHLADTEAGKIQSGTEDWMRLEGMVRALEGQKNYTLNGPSMAVLSTPTRHGLVGELMERLQQRYLAAPPTPELRAQARRIGSYFMSRLGRV